MVIVNDAIARALQELAQPLLADLQGLVAHVHAFIGEIEPDIGVPVPAVQTSKSEIPSRRTTTASPSMRNEVFRSLSAASTISGYRSDQSQPRRVSSRTRLPSR